jgi:AraC-like DNA-binding protein
MPSLIQQHILNIEDVAEVMGISKRTLQRNLGNAGINYREMLEQTRYAIARQKLANSELSVTELALDLGYSSSEHFSRAFKRWSGMSPLKFRRSPHLNQEKVFNTSHIMSAVSLPRQES